jgi:hypothetical protein
MTPYRPFHHSLGPIGPLVSAEIFFKWFFAKFRRFNVYFFVWFWCSFFFRFLIKLSFSSMSTDLTMYRIFHILSNNYGFSILGPGERLQA